MRRGEDKLTGADLQINSAAMKVFETELKLLVNQRLYEKGHITEEMYIRAKELIIKS